MTDNYYDKGLGGGRNTLDAKQFWDAAQDERLVIQQCNSCGEFTYPPQDRCAYCWSPELDWTEVSGEGEVHSFSTVHVGVHSTWEDEVPYTVAFIELEEGPILVSTLVDCEPESANIGMPVEVVFREVPAEEGLFPLFRPRSP
jgi:uncharacterized OB-fold protein